MPESVETIRWPAEYEPSSCPIHVRNELAMSAPVERVWAWLVRAQLWPGWYENSKNVRFLEGPPPDLGIGTRFRWTTFGVTIESRVREFVPYERLAWDAHSIGVHAYHAWLISKTPEGCRVLTEETQRGAIARLGSLLMPNRMHRFHQIWLEGLRDQAAKGMPPSGQ